LNLPLFEFCRKNGVGYMEQESTYGGWRWENGLYEARFRLEGVVNRPKRVLL